MSRQARLLDAMEQDLRQDSDDYLYLRGLMQELRQGLQQCDAAGVRLFNDRIQVSLDKLRERAMRRSKVLKAAGLAFDEAGMQRFIALYPAPRAMEIQAQWQQLGQIARQCQQLNESNGQLLASQQEILVQLQGSPQGDNLYGLVSY